jgi:hypothetical protein
MIVSFLWYCRHFTIRDSYSIVDYFSYFRFEDAVIKPAGVVSNWHASHRYMINFKHLARELTVYLDAFINALIVRKLKSGIGHH